MSHLAPVPDEPTEPGRTPPQDIAAEQSVLGGMLLSKEAIPEVVEIVQGGDFYRPAHEVLFAAILDLFGRNEPTDAVTVAAELTKRGELSRVGGPAYLHTLISSVPTAANAGYYAQIVAERAVLRRLVAAGTRVTQMGYAADGGEIDELVNAAVAEVERVANRAYGQARSDLDEAIDEALTELEVGIPAAPSGIPDLDDMIHGLIPGHLVTIGARPSIGKSAAGEQIVLAAIERGEPAGISSMEMGRAEIIHRAAANLGRVDFGRLRRSPEVKLTDAEWRAIANATAALRKSSPAGEPLLFLSDRTDVTVAQIRHDIRAHSRRHGRPPTCWFVDYLQLLKPSRESAKEGRERQVAALARDLKLTAKAERTCIIVGSQLNRAGNDKPGMIHLRESGAVEQDSDRVILLHRDLDPDGDPTVMEWIVAKNRQGKVGVVTTTWEGHYQRISRQQWSPSATLRGAS